MFNVGLRIRELRKLNNMTLEQLGEKVGLTQPQLSRLENGVNTVQLDTVFKICEVLNISIVEFFSTEDAEIIPSHFREFFKSNKELTPGQLKIIDKFINDFTTQLKDKKSK